MDDLYARLGLKSSATAEEIRRAYRVLARRYHPDVNPGKSEDRFKGIAEAYTILSDADEKRKYDAENIRHDGASARAHHANRDPDAARRRYEEVQRAAEEIRRRQHADQQRAARTRSERTTPKPAFFGAGQWIKGRLFGKPPPPEDRTSTARKLSIVEVSLSVQDAIRGAKKTIEVQEVWGPRKVSAVIPAGVYTGSVVRFREKSRGNEELVLIARVATHAFLSIEPKGLIVELPLSVREALQGAKVTAPTIDEPVVLTIPPRTQGGTDLRLKGKGIVYRDGTRGDLFYRVSIRIPESGAVPTEAIAAFPHIEGVIRAHLPKTLLD